MQVYQTGYKSFPAENCLQAFQCLTEPIAALAFAPGKTMAAMRTAGDKI
jgi:hypothetical protein